MLRWDEIGKGAHCDWVKQLLRTLLVVVVFDGLRDLVAARLTFSTAVEADRGRSPHPRGTPSPILCGREVGRD